MTQSMMQILTQILMQTMPQTLMQMNHDNHPFEHLFALAS
ncbi:hypothetical protein BIFGAL_02866 [Bifidobacterium gallicum DSM 20093 = LMG 11596]|uniref:Uncharacterized protein n=1 Tax=Bifidobacterium gallicum DSM 20093 = LMG 11596 TaxID=561180 RepID=D1NSV6_9BIFI|nr:hypothetical protein BIFGAL_02866 [Bifidobacterium gallicum DSM 20093 = LMG 11596]